MDTYHDGGDSSELGAQKETFKNRLSEAIDKPLTLENTDTYVDYALGAVIKLVDDVVAKYDAQPGAEWQQLGEANGKEHEDAALEYFGLEDVEAILRHLEDKASQFAVIGQVIAQANEASDVFVPPDSTPVPQATGSGTGMEKKGKQPKLENLLFVLMNDFGIDPDDPEAVSIVRGSVNPNMMREEPYYQVTVPGIDKVILVCDEYENVTFVFNGEWVRGQVNSNRSSKDESARPLTDYTKEELSKLIKDNPGQGARIMATKNFTANLVNALKGGFSQQKLNKPVDTRYLRSSKDLPPVPDGYATISEIGEELGVQEEKDKVTIRNIAIALEKQGKITRGTYRSRNGRPILAFTEKDARLIVEETKRRTAPIPEGYVSVTKFAGEYQQRKGGHDITYLDMSCAIKQLELNPVKIGVFLYLPEDEARQVVAMAEQLVSERLAIRQHKKVSLNRLSDVTGEGYSVVRRAAEKCGLIEKGASSRGRYFSVAEQGEIIKYLEERRARRNRAKGQLGGTALK